MNKSQTILSVEENFKTQIRQILGPIQHIDINNIPYTETSDTTKLCKKPLVSILCITYNHEKYIEQTFTGFEMQKCDFEFEVLIGEDCSTDNTLKLCKEFQQKHPEYVRLITSEKNVGAKRNSFRINKLARGKYIAFCEGDDCWITVDKLQKQIDFLESNPEYNFIHTNAKILSKNNEFKGLYHNDNVIREIKHSKDQISDRLLLKWPVATATTVIKKSDRTKILSLNPENIFTEQRRMGDIQLWTGMMSLGKMAYLEDITTIYHLSDESASRSKNPRVPFILLCDAFEVYLKLNFIYNGNNATINRDILRRTARQFLLRAYEVKELTLLKTANKLLRLYGEKNLIIISNLICSTIHAPFWVFNGILKFYTLCNKCRNVFISKKKV